MVACEWNMVFGPGGVNEVTANELICNVSGILYVHVNQESILGNYYTA